jgi:hypothetical protein
LWGIDYDAWCNVRFGCLAAVTFMILIHLILQWNWVCNFVASRLSRAREQRVIIPDGIKTLYGVGTLITVFTLLGMLLAVAEVMLREPRP